MARITSANKSGRPTPDSRRGAVLSAIIEEHLVTGDAIGSHTVSDRFANATGWSSATIRSVMCELEDFGLLEQPHTSAGRIPTDKGYRYYVDHMPDSTRLSKNDLRAIERIDLGGKSLLTIRDEMIALMNEEKALYDKLLHNAMLLCERSLQDEDEATAE